MNDDLQQFKDTYISECFELLEEMEEKLLGLDAESASREDLDAIFRCAHSIKGGAGAFGLTHISSFTHTLEALLDKMREGEMQASQDVVDCLLRARDVVYQMVVAAQDNSTLPDGYGQGELAELKAFCEQAGAETPSLAAAEPTQSDAADQGGVYHIHFKPQTTMIAHGNEPLLLLRELASLGKATIPCHTDNLPTLDKIAFDECYLWWEVELETDKPRSDIEEVFEFVEDECELIITEQDDSAATAAPAAEEASDTLSAATAAPTAKAPAAAASPAATPTATSIRVDIDKVDRLINMVGEVVITQSFLSAQVRDLPPAAFSELIHGVEEMMQHTRELQEAVMAVRMQPVKSIFSRMPRLVRDLAAQLGKEISLEMSGENTEVDKTIIEQLSDPLTHMIRNSADHGVEMPDVRAAAGKPRRGTIHLSAEHRGGRIVIEIKDDGGGINREKVKQKAIEKGVIDPNANLNDEEIDQLIFAAGFSTADAVSDVSGRGVGMDVVRRNIESIGGFVTVENTPGQGSVFAISLPLTLAILDGMIVRCGEEYYIVPINSIIETLRPEAGAVRRVADGTHVINVRGEFTPVLYLHHLFDIKGAEKDASKALVVLVESGIDQLGIVVDELVGQQQVVIKTLEENSDPVAGISGATILGDGKVSLILDIGQLARLNNKQNKNAANADNDNQEDPENAGTGVA